MPGGTRLPAALNYLWAQEVIREYLIECKVLHLTQSCLVLSVAADIQGLTPKLRSIKVWAQINLQYAEPTIDQPAVLFQLNLCEADPCKKSKQTN